MLARRAVLLLMLLAAAGAVPLAEESAPTVPQPPEPGGEGWWSTLWTWVRPWTWWRRSEPSTRATVAKTSVRCDEQTCTTFTCAGAVCTSHTCGIYDTDLRGYCRQYNTTTQSKGGDTAQKPLQLEAVLSSGDHHNITGTTTPLSSTTPNGNSSTGVIAA